MIGKMFRILDTEAVGSVGYDFIKANKDRWEDFDFEESSIDLAVLAAPRVVANDEKYGPTVYNIVKQYFITEGGETIRLVVLAPILQENENPLMTRMHNGSARYANGFIPGFTDMRLDENGNVMKDKDGNPIRKDTVKRIDPSKLVQPPTPEDPEELPDDAITLFTISGVDYSIVATNKKGETRTLNAEELLYGPTYVDKIVSATKAMGNYSMDMITIACTTSDLEHVTVDADTSVSLAGKTGAQHAIVELSKLLQQYMKRKTPTENGSGLTSELVPAFTLFHSNGRVEITNPDVKEVYYTNLPRVMDFHGLKILQAIADDLEIASTIVKSVEITTGSSIATVVLGNGVKIKSDISKAGDNSDSIVHILEDYIRAKTTKEDPDSLVANPSFRVWETGNVDVISEDGSSTTYQRANISEELVAAAAALFTEAIKAGYIENYDGTRGWGAWNANDDKLWIGMKNNVTVATAVIEYGENAEYKALVAEYYEDLMNWIENPPVDTDGYETSFTIDLGKNAVVIESGDFSIETLSRSLQKKIENLINAVKTIYVLKDRGEEFFMFDARENREGVVGYKENLEATFAVNSLSNEMRNLIGAVYTELLDHKSNIEYATDLVFDIKAEKIVAQIDDRTITAARSMNYTNMDDLFTMMTNLTNNFLAHFSISSSIDRIEFSIYGLYFSYTAGELTEKISYQDWSAGDSDVRRAYVAMVAWVPEKGESSTPDTSEVASETE